MRILQISNKAPYPPNDGSSIAVFNMAKGLIQNNAELHLLTINTKKHFKPDADVPPDFKLKSNYESVYQNTDVSVLGAVFNLFSKDSYFISRFYFKSFEEKLIEKLKQINFDAIHIEGVFMAPYIPIIRKYSTAKIFVRTHNAEFKIWERLVQNEKSFFKKIYLNLQNNRLKKTELELLQMADGIVTITETDKEIFKSLGIKNNFFVSPTGIDLDRYSIQPSNNDKLTFFHLGSMDWLPNIEGVDWFINNVYQSFFNPDDSVQFKFAGRFMPDRVFDLQQKNLLFLGAIDNNISFYNQNDVMLVPLQSGSGMRIKIIEGMAMGKAIISTTVGAEGIPVTHNENIIIADTPEEFATAIQQLLNQPELLQKLKRNARTFIQDNFDNKLIIQQLLYFYQTICNN